MAKKNKNQKKLETQDHSGGMMRVTVTAHIIAGLFSWKREELTREQAINFERVQCEHCE